METDGAGVQFKLAIRLDTRGGPSILSCPFNGDHMVGEMLTKDQLIFRDQRLQLLVGLNFKLLGIKGFKSGSSHVVDSS